MMGTVVTIRVVGPAAQPEHRRPLTEGIELAVGWFQRIEQTCSRFEEKSELRRLSTQIGTAVPVSPILFHTVQFALQVAGETNGAFDPTVGQRMEARGFNREYRSGQAVNPAVVSAENVTYRDVRLDPKKETITLLRPLVLDVGAVAKGLAIDLAARALQPFKNFEIDAGGDLYLSGHNPEEKPWAVGIRHPRDREQIIARFTTTNTAVCTSGDYERHHPESETLHHILDPRTGESAAAVASATVLAPSAMMADALATAAFVLGPVEGLKFLERLDVDGLLVTPDLKQYRTRGMPA
ncbi:MAG: FAD:protein FMN transferase [Opitutus sp.]|nr:FAD:protein FMN transferase [Opitutus sp.]